MISVLLYHQIAHVPRERDPSGLATPPERFEQQMAYLAKGGYRCLSLREAAHVLQTGAPQPDKAFVITFDDGFRDIYGAAWPILERFGFTATVFLVAGQCGGVSDWAGQRGRYAAPLLSWEEVRELNRAGLTFGGHTLIHPNLTELPDERVWQEVQGSKVMIEDLLEAEVDLFSYPYGQSDARVRRIVAESGYVAACGVDRSAWGRFNLWRTQCGADDKGWSFALKARGWQQRFIGLRESPTGAFLRRSKREVARLVRGRS